MGRIGTTKKPRGPDWRPAFVAQLALNANIRCACEAAGIGRTTAYRWRDDDPEFARQWDEAIEAGCDRLEEALFKRAVHGVTRTVWHQGEPVGEEQVYSDTAAIFLLKGNRKEKYAERTESRVSAAVQMTGEVDLKLLTDDELRTLDELYRAAASRAHQNGAGEKTPA
jgi:hypothetical protein